MGGSAASIMGFVIETSSNQQEGGFNHDQTFRVERKSHTLSKRALISSAIATSPPFAAHPSSTLA
jgi:hypothetical protein